MINHFTAKILNRESTSPLREPRGEQRSGSESPIKADTQSGLRSRFSAYSRTVPGFSITYARIVSLETMIPAVVSHFLFSVDHKMCHDRLTYENISRCPVYLIVKVVREGRSKKSFHV